MDEREIDLVYRALFGVGGLVVGFVGGWTAYFWKTREMKAEYEDLKRKRRLTKAKLDEELERTAKAKDIIIDLAKHNVSYEHFLEVLPALTGKPLEVRVIDDGYIAVPAEDVYKLMAELHASMLYDGIRVRLEAHERGDTPMSDDEVASAKEFMKSFEEEYGGTPNLQDEEARSSATTTLLTLLWITGAEVSVDDGPGFSWASLTEPTA
jgi:hypothetical protein